VHVAVCASRRKVKDKKAHFPSTGALKRLFKGLFYFTNEQAFSKIKKEFTGLCYKRHLFFLD